MTLMYDHRADHYIQSKPHALDSLTDIHALSDEGRGFLENAHTAHWLNDSSGLLRAVSGANHRLISIDAIAKTWAAEVEAAPTVCPDQLELPEAA